MSNPYTYRWKRGSKREAEKDVRHFKGRGHGARMKFSEREGRVYYYSVYATKNPLKKHQKSRSQRKAHRTGRKKKGRYWYQRFFRW